MTDWLTEAARRPILSAVEAVNPHIRCGACHTAYLPAKIEAGVLYKCGCGSSISGNWRIDSADVVAAWNATPDAGRLEFDDASGVTIVGNIFDFVVPL